MTILIGDSKGYELPKIERVRTHSRRLSGIGAFLKRQALDLRDSYKEVRQEVSEDRDVYTRAKKHIEGSQKMAEEGPRKFAQRRDMLKMQGLEIGALVPDSYDLLSHKDNVYIFRSPSGRAYFIDGLNHKAYEVTQPTPIGEVRGGPEND